MELEITSKVMLWTFILATILGAVINQTNFCTMGSISDLVNIGSDIRFRSWSLAIAVAILGVTILEASGRTSADASMPPYRIANMQILRYALGGFIFGIGMTLASGCGVKTLVRVGGGNLKSVLVLIVTGYFAYLMTQTIFYEVVFYHWVSFGSIDFSQWGIDTQDAGAVFAGLIGSEDIGLWRVLAGITAGVLILVSVFRSSEMRSSNSSIFAGLTVGFCVIAAWWVTGGAHWDNEGELATWKDAVSWLDEPPLGAAAQSFTFINPMGETFAYAIGGMNKSLITFGVISVFGVILGSFMYSIISRKFHLEWFPNVKDFVNHMVGAVLMGIGGVLGMGCTIGQAISGFSTLALGSIIVFNFILLGSAITMKIQYYFLVYEEDASFIKALLSTLVDLKLLPASMRKLDQV